MNQDALRTEELVFHALAGPEFELALLGPRDGTDRWLASPQLRYYRQRSCLVPGPDRRTVFLAAAPGNFDNEQGRTLSAAVGMLELEISPYDEAEVWLKYITVAPGWQRKGIAEQLLAMMVAHLKEHPRLLARSFASDEGARKIQGYIDALLDGAGVRWKQSGRVQNSSVAIA